AFPTNTVSRNCRQPYPVHSLTLSSIANLVDGKMSDRPVGKPSTGKRHHGSVVDCGRGGRHVGGGSLFVGGLPRATPDPPPFRNSRTRGAGSQGQRRTQGTARQRASQVQDSSQKRDSGTGRLCSSSGRGRRGAGRFVLAHDGRLGRRDL